MPVAALHTLASLDLPMSRWPAEIHPFEPVYGWMQRAADANHAFSTETFLQTLGLNGTDSAFEEQLEIVQQLPIVGYDHLEWSTPRRSDDGLLVCGHQVSTRFLSKQGRRVCPKCLDDGRYTRVWFDFVPIAACPHHDVQLIGSLDGDPIDWLNPELGWTRGGIKISGSHARPMEASEFDHYIYNSLAGEALDVAPHLAGQELRSVLQASLILGRLQYTSEVQSPTPERIRTLSQAGFQALAYGREAVIEFLSRADWLQPGYNKDRYDVRCHYVPQITATIPSEGLRNLVSECFGVTRVRKGLATPSGKLASFDGEDGAWTIESAARNFKLESKYLRKILEVTSAQINRCTHTRAYRLTQAQLDTVQAYIDASLSTDIVAEMLGCTADDIDELVKRRTITMDFRLADQRYFQRSAIDGFIGRPKAGRLDKLDPKGFSLSAFASEAGISLPKAYSQLIRNKTIGLVSLRADAPFFEGAIVSYFRGTRIRPAAQAKDAITFAKAKARLGTGADGLSQLIEMSYLNVVEDRAGRERICEMSLDAFERDYVRAADYAPLMGCPARSALILQRRKGVKPINEYGKRSVCFVSRAEVERLAGIKLTSSTGFNNLEVIRDDLAARLMSASVPANVRVVTDPAIVVEASSRNWSFRIEHKTDYEAYHLVAQFRSPHEGGRLRKVQRASVDAEQVWPGAAVHRKSNGGFVLVDVVGCRDAKIAKGNMLLDRAVSRSQELHQIL